jgi:predicted porin
MASAQTGTRKDLPGRLAPFRLSLLGCVATALILARGAAAADLATEAPAPPQSATAGATSCFASLYDFLIAGPDDCPLAWHGITLYGRLDYGVGYESHGVPFNGNYPNGVETLISKNSNGSRYTIVPNGLGQSYVGVKGDEPIAWDWSFVFKLQNGFDPFTLQRANGPKSLVQNNTTPLDAQTANGDSSRAGQLFNTEAYAGFSHPTYGEVTAGRQDSLITQGLGRFDPMGGAPNFSVIGVSNTAGGGGDTQTARFNTSLLYRVGVGPFHFATLYQFGGYNQGNGSNGAFALGMTGDFGPLTFGMEGQKTKDAVALSNFAEFPLPAGVPGNGLKATLSNNTTGVVGLKYSFERATLYSGWEYILFANPSDAYPDGFTAIGNYPVPAGYVNSTAYTEHKILRVFWAGIKYALRDDIDIAGAYYHYYQNDYNSSPSPCTDGGLSSSSCRGALNAYSAMIDYRPSKRVTAYAGFMWSQVTGGLASGYLYHINFAPTVGVRVEF